VDAVLVVGPAASEVLDHYLGRVLELDPDASTFEDALDGLREVLLAA
jgi:hypothetical protein